MKIGEKITVDHELVKATGSTGKRTVEKRHFKIPVQAIFLGDAELMTGQMIYGYGGDEPNYLSVSGSVAVSVVQPLEKSGRRYRKPFYIERVS